MEYKVIPFNPTIDPNKQNSPHTAEQLERLIASHTANEWKYVRMETVSTYVYPKFGCFGTQSKPGYTFTQQMVVFQK